MSEHVIFGDWRDLRGAIERASPEWSTATEETRQMLWSFAEAVIAEYAPMKVQCGPFGCGAVIPHWQGYRCADCKGVYCERCIQPHFGPNHRGHA